MTRLDGFVIFLAVVNVVVVVEVVRRRRMSEQFALLWLAIGLGGLVLGLGRRLIDEIAQRLGLVTGTSLVFSVAILFLLVVCMVLSSHVSRLRHDVETLAEEIALLRGVRPPAEPAGTAPAEAEPPIPRR